MATTIKTKIVVRNDIKGNWETANPTLSKGEIGLETDTLRIKVGNGVDSWTSLPYYNENKVGTSKDYSPKHPGDIAIVDGITYVYNGDDWKQIGVDAYTKIEIDQWASYDKDNRKLKIGAADELILETQHQGITLNGDGIMFSSHVTISGGLQAYGAELSELLKYDGVEQNVISTTYAKISYVDAEISNVMAVAEGKTQTFIAKYTDNAFLNSQDAEVSAPQLVTIDGTVITENTLKLGDVILVVETDVPDRWVKQVKRGGFVLDKLETTKVDLNPIINEIWGSSTSTTASSRIDNIENGNPICSLYVSGDGLLNFKYLNDAAGEVNLVEGVFGVSSIASNVGSMLASAQIVSNLSCLANVIYGGNEASQLGIFANGLISYGVSAYDICNQRSFIQDIEHSSGAIRDAVSYVSTLKNVHSAAEVASAISYVTTLKDTYYANEIISAVAWVNANQTKAITEVLSESLVVTHISNRLTINLPSVIWLDGGNAADSYDAEEALYDELLNNEYGG